MCGIVGLFAKTPAVSDRLGEHLGNMLVELGDRGPDSAGVAIYRDPAASGWTKLSLHAAAEPYDWEALRGELEQGFGGATPVEVRASHGVLSVAAEAPSAIAWLAARHPEIRVMSAGTTIEIYKEMGRPEQFAERFQLAELQGSHALGHTRMATESRVTTEHSHPFSTGLDLCLVHNGSLSNHNGLRRMLRARGHRLPDRQRLRGRRRLPDLEAA